MYHILFYGMILLYVSAGINHFINPQFYLKIMPAYIPYHKTSVFLSGTCEIIFALLLCIKSTKRLAAWLIIAMLIIFFTVHIQMIINGWQQTGILFWIPIIRFPLQFLLIWWAFIYTKAHSI